MIITLPELITDVAPTVLDIVHSLPPEVTQRGDDAAEGGDVINLLADVKVQRDHVIARSAASPPALDAFPCRVRLLHANAS
eukprot:scaffold9622_cov58-Phaeocystis_antarctica.AAC.1